MEKMTSALPDTDPIAVALRFGPAANDAVTEQPIPK